MNFENGDAIGVFTNETQRNTIALDKYGKKFADLTEAQKQNLSLDLIEQTYKLSGAMGQASRESEGYENVMGNLKESWRQFQAIIGKPVLQAVIPVVQKATDVILVLGDKAKAFGEKFSESMNTLKPTFEQYAQPVFEAFQSIVDTLKESWDIIFPRLQGLWSTFIDTIKVFWDSIGKPVFDTIKWVVVQLVDTFNQYFPQIAQLVGSVFSTISNIWRNVLQPVFMIIGDILKNILLPIFKNVFTTCLDLVKTAFTGIKAVWDNILRPVITYIIVTISELLHSFRDKFNNIKAVVTNVFNSISSTITSIVNGIKGFVNGAFNTIKTYIVDPISSAYNSVKTTFSNIYNTIKDKINSARDIVKSGIDKIKGFFNFNVSFPKIKLPHFKVKGSANPLKWLDEGVPKLSVEWYAKAMNNPMILNEPTAFGISENGSIRVGGEKGSELVGGTNAVMGLIRSAVADNNGNIVDVLERILMLLADILPHLQNMQLVLDTGALVGETAPMYNEEFAKIEDREGR